MNVQLRELLADVSLGNAICHERLRVIPLRLQTVSELEYLTLDEANQAGLTQIEEVSNGGSVPELRVRNDAKSRVLILDGTTLIGTKQNRIVNVSIMLAPQSVTVIPVSCVERGRWSYSSRRSSPGHYGDSHLRAMMCKAATASLKEQKAVNVDQAAVWDHVEGALAGSGASSPTRAYQAIYEQREQELREFESRFTCPDEACGVAIEIGGKLEAVELFDKPATLRKLWPMLTKSYVLSTFWRREPTVVQTGERTNVKDFLDRALRSNGDTFESIGTGKTVRLTTDDSFGAALLCDDQVVHLSVFADRTPRRGNEAASQQNRQDQPPRMTTEMPQAQPAQPISPVHTEQVRQRPWWKFWL